MVEMVGNGVGLLCVSFGGGTFEMMVEMVVKDCSVSSLYRRIRTPNPLA
jgi:hypothetical protein